MRIYFNFLLSFSIVLLVVQGIRNFSTANGFLQLQQLQIIQLHLNKNFNFYIILLDKPILIIF